MHQDITVTRWEGDTAREGQDAVAIEAPLEILINGERLAVTMRTPGDDLNLVAGFLFVEGIIEAASEIVATHPGPGQGGENRMYVRLKDDWKQGSQAQRWERNFIGTSSCGICGKTSLEAVHCVAPPLSLAEWRISARTIYGLNDQMRAAQRVFARTGGLHAAGLFTREGKLLSLKEDVGRHNALDKLIGAEVRAGSVPLSERILMVSGRASYEILQKAAAARLPIVCAVSAPSSLAVQLARDLNITLIGFLRGDTMNVYAAPERLDGN